jgi:hypothetical protein
MRNTEKLRKEVFLSAEILLVTTVISFGFCFVLKDSIIPAIVTGLLAAMTVGVAVEYIQMEKHK